MFCFENELEFCFNFYSPTFELSIVFTLKYKKGKIAKQDYKWNVKQPLLIRSVPKNKMKSLCWLELTPVLFYRLIALLNKTTPVKHLQELLGLGEKGADDKKDP